MRRGTFAAIVALFLLLLAALIYQLTVHGTSGGPACGPRSPNALPTKGACPSPTTTAPPT